MFSSFYNAGFAFLGLPYFGFDFEVSLLRFNFLLLLTSTNGLLCLNKSERKCFDLPMENGNLPELI